MMLTNKASQHLSRDPVLKQLIESIEIFQTESHQNLFKELTESIIYQQLSVKVAKVIAQRFYDLIQTDNPNPVDILSVDIEAKRSVGLSYQKANYIENIARFWIEHDLMDTDWESKPDHEIIELLTRIKGVGRWTVEMVLMSHLGRQDVFPDDDYGIRTQMATLYNLTSTGKQLTHAITTIAEHWRPFRSLACMYIWKSKYQK